MSYLGRFAAFWYDFIVGDDWLVAVGVVLLLAVAGLLARSSYDVLAWAIMPIGVVAVLAASLARAVAKG